MIIVSQDKTEIINFNNIVSVWIDSDEEDGFSIEVAADINTTLAYYKTEERAKEVLQEIIGRIVLTERFAAVCIPERQDEMVISMYDNNKPLFIYEMPEE